MKVVCIALVTGLVALVSPACAQDKLVAIDVLLEPDDAMLAAAEEWNRRLREQFPGGFSLDQTHSPHITLLQQYISEADLEAAVETLKSIAGSQNISNLNLTASGLYHIPTGDKGLQGITIDPSEEILALQAKVIEAMAPYRKSGGDEAAFVPDPTGTPFDPQLFTYVETFAEKQAGENYNPHVTTGIGPLEWVEKQENEPFEAFHFGVAGLAVYKLGNFGTAAERIGE